MAGLLDLVYTVLVVLVAAGGVLATLWITPSPDGERNYASVVTGVAVALFVVAAALTVI